MEKLNQLSLDKAMKLSIVAGILLISISFVFSNSIKPILDKNALDECLEDARTSHKERWAEYCKLDNRETGTDGLCLMGNERADRANDHYEREKNECFKRYPQK